MEIRDENLQKWPVTEPNMDHRSSERVVGAAK